MIDFLTEYGLFLAKTLTWAAAVLLVVGGIFSLARQRQASAEHLQVKNLSERLRETRDNLNDELLSSAEHKAALKARKAENKLRRKTDKQGLLRRPRLFVLDFDGDLQATAVASLREEISAVLQVARAEDEVLLRLESPGGLVHAYGLAASQLQRVRQQQIRLTVAVDKVAASGGYLMACVADRILSAPFAVLGSIGVVAQMPNFHRLLQKHEIDFELHTAGDYKRTLTVFGENTEAARSKFREELEHTHELFKAFVNEHRPIVDLAQVATGEHWYGTQALQLKLVDRVTTSDDYVLERARDCDVFELRYKRRRPVSERVAQGFARLSRALQGSLSSAEWPHR